ncbi:MAG: nucleotidyl transferase AbiEii/AbiGii toxin family protein [Gammaproteobacteria bacterium]|nr:nucleotidyl transferase AbiEii/AbiGii toxin family protein [Gammaproteobacteria bacterium]
MQELLKASREERAKYFQEATARSKNIKNVIIIEKDFWVCWTLDQMFSNPALSPHVTFKGGTSLSKCYNIIDRFSEDIDLTLSKQYIGITAENDPATATSNNQRSNRLEELSQKVKNKITNNVKPLLTEEFRKNIATYFDDTEWQLETDEKDEQSLIFHYPSCFEKKSDGYIQSSIKLEFGARGDISPCETKTVTTYAQQLLPELFDSPTEITVTALAAKRTYWEKITLLHAEYHRDHKKPLPSRLFRHYYDIAMLDKNNLTHDAMQDTALLSDVVRNKAIYFPSKWANYDEANIGTLRIYPNEAFIEQLKQDHRNMSEMFFGNAPDFNDTLSAIQNIERVINKK